LLPCPGAIKDVRDISRRVQDELEKFFIATDALEDKKLKMLGWAHTVALQAIKDGAKSFARK
jgi:inorganic pyrophosphatase